MIKAFGRWAKDQDISDANLLDAADKGIIAASLGDNLVKLRIARMGQRKSGGYRAVVAFKASDRAFFLDGWGKNEFENINDKHLKYLKKLAGALLELDENDLRAATGKSVIREIERRQSDG